MAWYLIKNMDNFTFNFILEYKVKIKTNIRPTFAKRNLCNTETQEKPEFNGKSLFY
jgi:hypothetical protein